MRLFLHGRSPVRGFAVAAAMVLCPVPRPACAQGPGAPPEGPVPGAPAVAAVTELPQDPGWEGLPQAASGQVAALPGSGAGQATGACTLRGTVRDTEGAIVPGASLTLLGEGRIRERVTTSDDAGDYAMLNVPCGQFVLTVAMTGFQPLVTGSEMLDAGETLNQDVVLKLAGTNTTVNVVATQAEIAQAQVHLQEQQRMLGAFPNFFVSYQWQAAPLRPRQKFGLALRTAADPANLVLAGAIAGVQQASDSLPGYGQGAAGYGRRFGANVGNVVVGTFLGGAVLPSIFRQDPRYFYLGTGSTRRRFVYAVTRAFVTRGDNGRNQVNFSGLLGDLGSGAISNAYAAREDRQGAGLTLENGGLAIAGDCFNNVLQEFVLRKLTTKTRGRRGKATSDAGTP